MVFLGGADGMIKVGGLGSDMHKVKGAVDAGEAAWVGAESFE